MYFKHECPFKEDMMKNKYQLTNISPVEDLKLQTIWTFAMSKKTVFGLISSGFK